MSAWIVSREHIDLLVKAIYEGPRAGVKPHGMSWQVPYDLRDVSRDEVGRILWNENVKSVRFRYPDEKANELPGPTDFALKDAREYRYREPGYQLSLTEAFNAIDCYSYQSCEHRAWGKSRAKELVAGLRDGLTSRVPGERGPWGWDAESLSVARENLTGPA